MTLLERQVTLDWQVGLQWHVALVTRVVLDWYFTFSRRRCWRKVQEVANLDIGGRRSSRCKLDYRLPAEAHRDSPWTDVTRNPDGPSIAVDEDHIDRKPHERGMDGHAWREQQTLGDPQTLPTEQTSTPGRSICRNLDFERNR
jgi:hypothetical protein